MEHVVFFPAPDGAPAFRRVADLDEAVRLVEHLRNVEGIANVSVHSLTEVPLAFRAYYKAEVPAGASVPEQAPGPPVPAPEPLVDAPVLALVEDVPAPDAAVPDAGEQAEPVLAASTGSRPDSLGFFA